MALKKRTKTQKTVVTINKTVQLEKKYILKAYDDAKCVKEETVSCKPTDNKIAEFIESVNALYCTVEELYYTSTVLEESDNKDDDDWDPDEWEI